MAWDVLDLELSLVGQNLGPPEFSVRSHAEGDNGGVSICWVLWEAVVVDMGHVVCLDVVTSGVEELLESLWEIFRPLKKESNV